MDVDCGSARDRLGRTLGGKYHLREVLGAGGTAVVYRAQSLTEDVPVAIKVLHDHLSRSEEVCRRFVREGQLGNALEHPGTVRVLDFGTTEEGCPYLVLEMLEGESLEERRVRNGGRLEMWETLDFCDQLLAVLEIAHAKSIVHRDIKPSNLFITQTGVLKVLDFGIARFTDDTSSATSTKTGTMVGTPAFMPPEQALSRPREVDARTDIWSVGATLFTLLSGEHVHIAETSSEHLVKAATLHARSLARALPGVPANVEGLVARCLSFDKNDRWASATTMRHELSFVRDDPGRRIGTSTSPPPERYPSNPNVPTVIGSMKGMMPDVGGDGVDSPPRSYRGSPRSDRPSDHSDVNMSLNSVPGAYDLMRPGRRRWLLPFAITTTVMLALVSILALMLAVRTTPAASASAAAPPAAAAPAVVNTNGNAERDMPPVIELPPTTETAPAPVAAAASPRSTSASTSITPAASTPSPRPTTTTITVTTTPRKPTTGAPAPKGPFNKDLYRPF